MKKVMFALAGVLFLLASLVVTRAFLLPAASGAAAPMAETAPDRARLADALSRAIQIRTVSWGDGRESEAAAFGEFAALLESVYPNAHRAMTRETAGGSLLFRWPGAAQDEKPVAFLAHIDVVPVDGGEENAGWKYPPFSGAIAEGAVWGRGALDNKGQIIALMEAAEALAANGFRPRRDVYFLFGHDEELGGDNGARAMARLLKQQGVRFAWTIDEGSGLVEGVIPGVERPVALLSVAEKGSTTLRFTARDKGGHSSAPSADTAVSLAARAVVAVTEAPYPLELDENVVAFLHAIAPELPFVQRAALANLWLTGAAVKKQLAQDPTIAASLRTTTAATIIEGGVKTNVLPQTASAYVNYRIHPRDSAEAVKARAVRLIDDPRVEVEAVGAHEPSPRSSTESDGYAAMSDSVTAVFGAVPIAPSLTVQATDTRNYAAEDIADDYYRFTPFIYRTDDLQRIHGADERVMIEDLVRAARFYEDLLRRAAAP